MPRPVYLAFPVRGGRPWKLFIKYWKLFINKLKLFINKLKLFIMNNEIISEAIVSQYCIYQKLFFDYLSNL